MTGLLQSGYFVCLLAAHALGDFPAQPDRMVRAKRTAPGLLLHAAVVTGLSYVLLGAWGAGGVMAVLFGSHAVMDAVKARLPADRAGPFLLDQGVHVAVLLGLSAWLARAGAPCWWHGPGGDLYLAALKVTVGLVAQIWVGGLLVGYGLQPFTRQMDPPPARLSPGRRGFDNGGRIIGYLERSLVYFFVLSGQAAAVGFLVTAKSVFRFGELKDGDNRKETEYIIIGSLASFAYALPVAWLIQRWI